MENELVMYDRRLGSEAEGKRWKGRGIEAMEGKGENENFSGSGGEGQGENSRWRSSGWGRWRRIRCGTVGL